MIVDQNALEPIRASFFGPATQSGETAFRIPERATDDALGMQFFAGIEVSLARVQAALLMARTFQATVQLFLPRAAGGRSQGDEKGVAIHFGLEPCRALMAGLLESVRKRLTEIASGQNEIFLVEVTFLSEPYPISIHIRAVAGPSSANIPIPPTGFEVKITPPNATGQNEL